MKQVFQSFFLTLVLCMGACSSEELCIEDSKNDEIKKITAVIPDFITDDVETRTIVSMGEYSSFEPLVWADGDVLGIFPNIGDQISFPIVKGGSTTCSFDGGGWALRANASYNAYYPFNSSYFHLDREVLPVTMLGQKQTGNNNSDHLSNYDLLISAGTAQPDGSLLFKFSRQVSIVRLELEAPQYTSWTSVSLRSDAGFTTNTTMNLKETPPVLEDPSVKSGKISLELNDVKTNINDKRIIAYMILLPVDLTDKSLSVSITDNEGYVYTSEATIVNESKNFNANSIKWIRANNFKLDTDILNVTQAGTLSTLISAEEQTTLTELKLKGYLNGDDIAFIRGMSKLESLDLSEANIVAGGKSYYKTSGTRFGNDGNKIVYLTPIQYTTSNNEFPENFASDAKFSSTLSSIVFPQSITKIGASALYGCNKITSIDIPENVTEIGNGAFQNCNLKSIYIPKNVSKIEGGFIMANFELENIHISEQNPYFRTQDGVLYNHEMSTLISCPRGKTGDFTIPTGITEIGDFAFFTCTRFTNITIPETVTKIGNYAFANCNGCKSFTIPNSVTKIGESAFRGNNYNLESITLSNKLSIIEDYTFDSCSKLVNISNIGQVETIGFSAFGGCTELATALKFSNLSEIKGNAFISCKSLPSIEINGNRAVIRDNAFEYCTSLSTVKMEGVTGICRYAFAYSGLTSVDVSNVEIIEESVFYSCKSLSEVKLPNDISCIEEYAFAGCSSLDLESKFNYPTSLKYIKNGAFQGCKSPTIKIPEGVEEIGESTFANMNGNVTTISLPSTLKVIGKDAFLGCGNPDFYSYAYNPPTLEGNITKGRAGVYIPAGSKDLYINSSWIFFGKDSFTEMSEE